MRPSEERRKLWEEAGPSTLGPRPPPEAVGRWRQHLAQPVEMMRRSRRRHRHSGGEANCSCGLRFAASALDRPGRPLLMLKAYRPLAPQACGKGRYDDEWLYGEVPLGGSALKKEREGYYYYRINRNNRTTTLYTNYSDLVILSSYHCF